MRLFGALAQLCGSVHTASLHDPLPDPPLHPRHTHSKCLPLLAVPGMHRQYDLMCATAEQLHKANATQTTSTVLLLRIKVSTTSLYITDAVCMIDAGEGLGGGAW